MVKRRGRKDLKKLHLA
ncbi:unnamed protein product [Victoria cruziana]